MDTTTSETLSPAPASFRITQFLFLRALAFIYLIAFVSLAAQIDGLIGRNGILPFHALIQAATEQLGLERYYELPTLFWVSSSDRYMHVLLGLGILNAVLAFIGVGQRFCFAALWAIYLSFQSVSSPFLSFQWDALLLETGFLATFLAPIELRPTWDTRTPPSRVMIWLLRFLLFRLMFSSGFVKLGDETWTQLLALQFHYETQPLPTPVAWYAHQLPSWFHQFSVAIMFLIELLVPFAIMGPRRVRHCAGFAFLFLMALILLTGNYCFFNWLTITLTIPLFDDAFWRRILPTRLSNRFDKAPFQAGGRKRKLRWGYAIAGTLFGILGACALGTTILPESGLRDVFRGPLTIVAPYRLANTYGLFANMTTIRPEIVIEGSDNGVTWREYPFRYKPGALNGRPRWVAPHQPRLDWQMWFAALSSPERNRWFRPLLVRLLQGEADVVALFATNPFPDKPPRYVRALMYQYNYTRWDEGRGTGNWWKRQLLGEYVPPMSLGGIENH